MLSNDGVNFEQPAPGRFIYIFVCLFVLLRLNHRGGTSDGYRPEIQYWNVTLTTVRLGQDSHLTRQSPRFCPLIIPLAADQH